MKLLIITQKVDRNDPILGFFHRWIEEFAKNFEKVIVICLEEGNHNLPDNVSVLSLGKEKIIIHNSLFMILAKLKYVWNFYNYIFKFHHDYDAVFVHMNQEYVLLGWKFWKLWGKKIYLWRNHAKGGSFTRLAVFLSNKVFYTSPQSFTAKFKKSIKVPVGIDTDFFKPDSTIQGQANSILFLGRIAPIKKVLEFVEWFNRLDEKFHATVAGSALEKDSDYEKLVRSRASDRVSFIGAVTQNEALKLYQSHKIYANFTLAGSMDKTIFEAAACETSVIVSNQDLKILENKKGKELRDFVMENHSLAKLLQKLSACILL